jgi:hypothetical protein
MKFYSLKGLIKYARVFKQFAIWSVHKIFANGMDGVYSMH